MSTAAERVQHEGLRGKIMSAAQAAEFIADGMTVGSSMPPANPTKSV